jgi:hypothetical protein
MTVTEDGMRRTVVDAADDLGDDREETRNLGLGSVDAAG